MSRSLFSPHTSRAVPLAQGVSLVTISIAVAFDGRSLAATLVCDVLLCIQMVAAGWAWLAASRQGGGTRRVLFGALAVAAALALAGHATWTLRELVAGAPPRPPLVEAWTGIGVQLVVMYGYAAALAREGHRNWMRVDAIVDAALLIVALAIVLLQVDFLGTTAAPADGALRFVAFVWGALAIGTLILVAILLVWRGDVLGPRLAAGLAVGTIALALANLLYAHLVLPGGGALPPVVAALWSVATLAGISAIGPRVGALAESGESPTFVGDLARVRTISIVVAILIATGSAAAVALRGDASPRIGVAIAAFGLLLALRAGWVLRAQQRTTTVLEQRALQERELSALLEQRVTVRTRELAEAHRVMQRMWTLGQQIALELAPERVLQRFVEAVTDVVRVDGAAVALQANDRLMVAVADGIGRDLAGVALPLAGSAMGRVMRSGEPWSCTGSGGGDSAEPDLLGGAGVRAALVLPLQRRGARIGAAALYARDPRVFTDTEVAHVEAMADLLSVALANADLVETLRRTEWRFRTLFRAAPDAVFTVFESGRVREANDAVRDVFGLFPVQMVGRGVDEFVLPDDRDAVADALTRALGGAPVRLEARMRHEAGVRIVDLAARRLPEADPPLVLVVGRDVTVEREMRARLAETERLAAVAEFVAGVAHEVNNPLSTISAMAQLLQRDPALDDDQRDSATVIHAEAMRASQVLRDLLAFARRSESDAAALSMNELVERSLRLRNYDLTAHGVAVETELAPDLPGVSGDARQLQQVLLNLIANAVQAMAPNGGGRLRIVTGARAGRVHVDVCDTGPGVPPEARAHIFEPFFTTKHDGTGLGLSVSYGIAAAHGGSISLVESSAGGTTIRVALPACVEPPPDEEENAERDEPGDRPSPILGRHVLLVDDEPSIRDGVRTFGRRRGFRVTAVGDGPAALAAARREPFDAVVCDLRMPGMDGAAFHAVLRQEHAPLAGRTLFVTGDLVSAATRAFLASTSQPVLTKPFDLLRLEDAIAAVLRDAASPAPRAAASRRSSA